MKPFGWADPGGGRSLGSFEWRLRFLTASLSSNPLTKEPVEVYTGRGVWGGAGLALEGAKVAWLPGGATADGDAMGASWTWVC